MAARRTLELLSDRACSTAIADYEVTRRRLEEQAKTCAELLVVLCTGVGEGTETCATVREEVKRFASDQCVAMLEQRAEIIAELQARELALQPLDDKMQRSIAAADAPSFGPADAKVTIVEFSDFQCPYCSRAAGVVQRVKARYGDHVRFVFRQFPLAFHEHARGAAEASLAAHAQGRFWEFHDKVFENQSALERSSLEEYATSVGMDLQQFKSELAGGAHTEQVTRDLALGQQAAVQGTPTMFVNGRRVGNPTDFGEVSHEIDEALAR